jgi:uncharacterized protein YndB with AHSA1/START domain
MSAGETQSVEREIRIAARPDVIFAYFVDPGKMVKWKGVLAELDPRPGGIYRVNVTGREIARGEYVEIVPYQRVVFTWGWEGEGSPLPPGSSVVEVTLVPDGPETIVRLVHSRLPVVGAETYAVGWEHFLPRLAQVAAGSDPGPDPWVTAGMGESGPEPGSSQESKL